MFLPEQWRPSKNCSKMYCEIDIGAIKSCICPLSGVLIEEINQNYKNTGFSNEIVRQMPWLRNISDIIL